MKLYVEPRSEALEWLRTMTYGAVGGKESFVRKQATFKPEKEEFEKSRA